MERQPSRDIVLELEAPTARGNLLHLLALLRRVFGEEVTDKQRDLLERIAHAERTMGDLVALLLEEEEGPEL
jgi:hypothetical protein